MHSVLAGRFSTNDDICSKGTKTTFHVDPHKFSVILFSTPLMHAYFIDDIAQKPIYKQIKLAKVSND